MKTLEELKKQEIEAWNKYNEAKKVYEKMVKPFNDAWMASMRAVSKEELRIELESEAQKEQHGNA